MMKRSLLLLIIALALPCLAWDWPGVSPADNHCWTDGLGTSQCNFPTPIPTPQPIWDCQNQNFPDVLLVCSANCGLYSQIVIDCPACSCRAATRPRP